MFHSSEWYGRVFNEQGKVKVRLEEGFYLGIEGVLNIGAGDKTEFLSYYIFCYMVWSCVNFMRVLEKDLLNLNIN